MRAIIVFFVATFVNCNVIVDGATCSQTAKAETYLEAASGFIDKLKDNFPDGEVDCGCPKKPMDCSEWISCGRNVSGIYKVWPKNRIMKGSIDVYCDMEAEGGGWTVIQKRGDFKRPADFFQKNWQKYKTGFGDLRKDFYLGNDNIYALTNQNKYFLLVDLIDNVGNPRYAIYDQFWIDGEPLFYKLHASDYSGDAGDSLALHNGQMFSTYDKDNDNSTKNCAEIYKGGWWFWDCLTSNLNGLYGVKNDEVPDSIANIRWDSMRALKSVEMKIRPANYLMHYLDLGVDAV